jgi:hypothetical protein
MKALLFVTAVSLGAGACSSKDQTFSTETVGGTTLCYRTTHEATMGCSTHTEKVKALNENCGLPPRTQEG